MTTRPVQLRLPADSAYVSVLRTTTAALAARLDFTVDDIEDLRIAVGEAAAMVLAVASPDGELAVTYTAQERTLKVEVHADADRPAEPDRDGFAWQVLAALTTDVDAAVSESSMSITLTTTSTLSD